MIRNITAVYARVERVVQQVLVATGAELAASGYRAFRMDVVSANR